jgi:hypothetical protein
MTVPFDRIDFSPVMGAFYQQKNMQKKNLQQSPKSQSIRIDNKQSMTEDLLINNCLKTLLENRPKQHKQYT